MSNTNTVLSVQGFITINGKKVKKADIKADNGVIHTLSDVLYPIPENDLADTLIADERYQSSPVSSEL